MQRRREAETTGMKSEADRRIAVLVVDDHRMFAQAVGKVLEEEDDIRVVGIAGSVAEAVESARRCRPDVVLMDFELPDGDGATATKQIKDDRPETCLVMLTSFNSETVLVSSVEAGCSGFISKHRAMEEVVEGVRAAYRGEAMISPVMLARLLPRLRRTYRGVGTDLTAREVEVLRMLAEGLPNPEIAEKLAISLHTVRNHVQNILTKMQAHSKLEAVSIAVREGIIRYPG